MAVGARQRPDFDELDASTMQQSGDFGDRGTGGDDVVDHGDVAVVALCAVVESLAHVVGCAGLRLGPIAAVWREFA